MANYESSYTGAQADAGVAGGILYAANKFTAATKAIFYQDTAPTTWTIANTLDDKLLFITKGSAAGGQTGGGSHSTGTWTQPNHTHTGPSHTHTGPSHTHTGPSHTHTGPSHAHAAGTLAGPSHTHTGPDHTHTGPSHPHQWFSTSDGSSQRTMAVKTGSQWSRTYDSNGNLQDIPLDTADLGNSYTSNSGTGATGAAGTGATGASGTAAVTGSTAAEGTGATGAGGTGATGADGTGATGGSATANTWRPAAYCAIIATKDAY